MNRRIFIRNTSLITGALLAGPQLLAGEKPKKCTRLTILHTNDTHSNIDPFPLNHAKYPGLGGVARRYDLFQQVRSEEPNVIVLDSGDIFQGTPYFNKYGGVLEMKVMSEMGYDAGTMGNHDFDAGMDGFLKAKQFANFPFVCANYDFSDTILKDHVLKNTIIERGGIKIGVFGIGVELKGLVPDVKYGNTKYLDPPATANMQASELKEKGCDLIICLSHLGFEYADEKVSDKILASKTSGIHLILGGHTHTFLNKPYETKNLSGDTVLINQVGYAGVQVGRLDYCFDKKRFITDQVIQVK
jgi:5'-nucleotidase